MQKYMTVCAGQAVSAANIFIQRENRPRWYAGGFHSDITEDLSVVRTPKEGEQVFKQKGRAPFSTSVRR